MLIGLTGGIASGKSTAVKYLQRLGAKTIDSDKIAHQVLEPGNEGYRRVVKEFGEEILDKHGEIDRKRLGKMVFSSPTLLSKLEDLTHPLIIAEIKEKARLLQQKSENPVVLDAPLLFEKDLDSMVDEVWVVYVRPEIQLKRLMARDNLSEEEARARINAQLPLEQKRCLADRVLDNSGTEEDLQQQIENFWLEICKECGRRSFLD